MGQETNSNTPWLWALIPPLLAIGTGAISALWLLPLSLAFLHLRGVEGFDGTSGTHDDDEHYPVRRSHGLDLFDHWPRRSAGFEADRLFGSSIHSDWLTPGLSDNEPAFNIDGTPMLGAFDIHGNPYGVTSPTVNVDGTPMVGSVDMHGHPYGVTDAHSWGVGGSSGFSDTWHHADAVSSCARSDPWSSCGTTDSWSSCASSETWSGSGSRGSMWD
jgi:hypothetical protein